MKKTVKKGLHPSQKNMIRKYIISYYLFSVSSLSDIPEVETKKAQHIKPEEKTVIEDWQELAPVLNEEPEPEEEVPKSVHKSIKSEKLSDKEVPRGYQFIATYQRRLLRFAVVIFGICILVTIIQVLYPNNRALPLSRLESIGFVGTATTNDILKNFEDFDSRVVTVHTHTKTLTTSYKDLGVIVEPEKTVQEMTSYSWRERLTPFSIIFKSNKSYPVKRDINQSQLNLYASDVIALNSKKPVDAIVELEGTKLGITPSEDGFEYQTEVLRSQILRSDLSDKGQIVFAPTILYPNISTDLAQSVVNKLQARLNNPIIINAEGKIKKIDSKTMASWVFIKPKPTESNIEIGFDVKKVSSSLKELSDRVDIAPVPTVITYLNGHEAGRKVGKVGKLLKMDSLVDRVSDLESPTIGTLDASVLTIPPKEVSDRKYTKDNKGLETLIEYWVGSNAGDYAIDLRSLNGQIKVTRNAYQLYPSVGIYRAYIASLVYARINAQSVSLNSVTVTGKTVDTCLMLMLSQSDDSCTEALGSLVGWSASDSILRSQGFLNSTLTHGASLTTANDATLWLAKMLSNEITTVDHEASITESMINQQFKGGIAGGIPGTTVASRSGSYGRINNDMGVVYNASGTYLISILSEGSNFDLIADLSREINNVMSQ